MPIGSPEKIQVLELHLPERPGELRVPGLDGSSIHLWHASPQECESCFGGFTSLLSSDENDRRMRFHFEGDRQDFAFAHGMLRSVLAGYLKTDPQKLRFGYSEHSKPFLTGLESGLRFNLSHTQGAVLLAVCREREIGVDVERIREDFDPREIATRFFSEAEQRALVTLPQTEQRPGFFRCWTRKEAFLKARGHGLSFPLDLFDVSIGADETEVTLVTRPDATEARRWQIVGAPAPEGCVAAVAVASSCPADMNKT
jgi:4'-phosphopantetheinyl transferase